jgi:benzoyl-CoA reductase/2-hydroxyglutaryl-CoA dehydratase subunit BcrC/BadD/HgdB
MEKSRGLALVESMISQDRLMRVKELKRENKKALGYMCCFVPLEMLTAVDIVPFRLLGDPNEATTEADKYFEKVMCSFVRSAFDLSLKDAFSFADGVIFSHSCDALYKTWEYWNHFKPAQFEHFFNIPHVVKPSSECLLDFELDRLKKALEAFTGIEMTNTRLRNAIRLHNRNRALLRQLSELRKENPPRITGTQMRKILIVCMSLPVEEANTLLEDILAEVKNQPAVKASPQPRVFLYGPELDNDFVDLIEECGASVVIDDTCIGTRYYCADCAWGIEPLKAINRRYLEQSRCPRTYRRPEESRQPGGRPYNYVDDMELRYDFLRNYAEDWQVNGAVFYLMRYCDSHEFDAPDARDFLQKAGFPVLFLEGDYTVVKEQMRTRIQAFLEMLDQ